MIAYLICLIFIFLLFCVRMKGAFRMMTRLLSVYATADVDNSFPLCYTLFGNNRNLRKAHISERSEREENTWHFANTAVRRYVMA